MNLLDKIDQYLIERNPMSSAQAIELQGLKDAISRAKDKMRTATGAAKQSFADEISRLNDRIREKKAEYRRKPKVNEDELNESIHKTLTAAGFTKHTQKGYSKDETKNKSVVYTNKAGHRVYVDHMGWQHVTPNGGSTLGKGHDALKKKLSTTVLSR